MIDPDTFHATMSITVLLASSRAAGNTRALVDLTFPCGEFALEDLNALNLGFYSYEQANHGDDFLPLLQRLIAHHTWVLATPLHWYTMSAQAKVFLDRLSDCLTARKDLGRQLRGKRLAVLCTGADATAPSCLGEPFALTCAYLGMEYLGTHYMQFQDTAQGRRQTGPATESFARTLRPGNCGLSAAAHSQAAMRPCRNEPASNVVLRSPRSGTRNGDRRCG